LRLPSAFPFRPQATSGVHQISILRLCRRSTTNLRRQLIIGGASDRPPTAPDIDPPAPPSTPASSLRRLLRSLALPSNQLPTLHRRCAVQLRFVGDP